MFVNESIEDVLKGKTKKQVRSDFKNQFGIAYVEKIEKTLEKLQSKGVDGKIETITVPGYGSAVTIVVAPWEVKRSQNGFQWEVIATVVTEKLAQEIVDFLKPRLDIGARNEYQYEIKQSHYELYFSNVDALKVLSKLKK